jgi:hypothetical protein
MLFCSMASIYMVGVLHAGRGVASVTKAEHTKVSVMVQMVMHG